MSAEYRVVDSVETSDALVEVLDYPKLLGSSDARSAEQLP